MEALQLRKPMGGFSEPMLQLLALCGMKRGGGREGRIDTEADTGRRNRGKSELEKHDVRADSENFNRRASDSLWFLFYSRFLSQYAVLRRRRQDFFFSSKFHFSSYQIS